MIDKISIALADDHTMVRQGIIAMLSDDEYAIVAEANDGKELMRQISALRTPPQVCIVDIRMPEMDGYETLVAIKQKFPDTKVLILSQYDDEFVIIKMLKAGASGFLHKDARPSELKDAIRIVLSGSYYQNELVNGHIFSLVRRPDEQLVLSEIELNFLKYACSELTYKEIADRMGISKRTVEGHRERLFEKLGVKSRTALALYALKLGLTPIEEHSTSKGRKGLDG